MQTLAEIRQNLADTTRQTQINDLIDSFINLTLQEINTPGWAFNNTYEHLWSFNRRKTSISVSSEFTPLPRDLDRIALVRQTSTPAKLLYVPDEIFFRYIPNPTTTGNPLYYRIWEDEGVSTITTANSTIKVSSSSASDGSSIKISIVGYDTNNILQSEVLSLNGTTEVTSSTTFASGRLLKISKSAQTVGNITIVQTSSSATILILGKEERAARFKVIGLYPIPTSSFTLYLEYYTRIRQLVNASDVPDVPENWIWVVKQGALSKIYQYQNKPNDYTATQAVYAAGIRSMVKSDLMIPDYIPELRNTNRTRLGVVELADESWSLSF